MGDFAECLGKAVSAGKLSKEKADILLEQSKDSSIEDVLNGEAFQIAQNKRESILQAIRLNDLNNRAVAFNEVYKGRGNGYVLGFMASMVRDLRGIEKGFNIDYRARTLSGGYQAMIANMLSRFRTRRVGFTQDGKGLIDFVRGVFGEEIADPDIKGFVDSYKALLEEMREAFNKAGGNINRKEDYNLPQSHNINMMYNPKKSRDSQREAWVAFTKPLLDRKKMVDDKGIPLTDDQLDDALRYSYDSIVSDGLNKVGDLEAVPKGLGRKLSKKHSERRFLHFAKADDWIAYNEKYGSNDIFSTINSHIEVMAHETALMELYGPNPQLTFETMLRQAKKNDATDAQIRALENQWAVVSGKVNNKVVPTIADVNQATRNVITASTLGSAVISALSDATFSAITSIYRGLSSAKVYANQVKLLNPANEADRILAVEMGLTAEAWISAATSANRFGETYGIGFSAKISEAVMRGSGLSAWTDAGRKAFGMEFSSALAKNFGNTFDELPNRLRKGMEEYGIDAKDWDAFRKTKKIRKSNAVWADFTQDKSGKFINMVLTETDFAVPSPDARTRRFQTGGQEAGTWPGEITRHFMALKSFPITLVATHGYRMASQHGMKNKAAYGGSLILSTTLMGGMVIQLKDVAAGREPRPIGDTPEEQRKFLFAAMQQGGGLGIFGDFLFSDVNRFGGGLVQTAIGPVPELVDKAAGLTLGNIQNVREGEETEFARELGEFARRYTPKTWQTRLLTDALYDQAILWADPKAQKRFNQAMKKRQREYQQGYWWRKGEALPEVLQ